MTAPESHRSLRLRLGETDPPSPALEDIPSTETNFRVFCSRGHGRRCVVVLTSQQMFLRNWSVPWPNPGADRQLVDCDACFERWGSDTPDVYLDVRRLRAETHKAKHEHPSDDLADLLWQDDSSMS